MPLGAILYHLWAVVACRGSFEHAQNFQNNFRGCWNMCCTGDMYEMHEINVRVAAVCECRTRKLSFIGIVYEMCKRCMQHVYDLPLSIELSNDGKQSFIGVM